MSTDDAPRASDATPPTDPMPPVRAGFAGEIQERRFRAALWRAGRWALAIVLTLVAIFFGLVPGIPGFPLFFLALFLLANDFPPARRLGSRLLRRFPKVRRAVPKRWRTSRGQEATRRLEARETGAR